MGVEAAGGFGYFWEISKKFQKHNHKMCQATSTPPHVPTHKWIAEQRRTQHTQGDKGRMHHAQTFTGLNTTKPRQLQVSLNHLEALLISISSHSHSYSCYSYSHRSGSRSRSRSGSGSRSQSGTMSGSRSLRRAVSLVARVGV